MRDHVIGVVFREREREEIEFATTVFVLSPTMFTRYHTISEVPS